MEVHFLNLFNQPTNKPIHVNKKERFSSPTLVKLFHVFANLYSAFKNDLKNKHIANATARCTSELYTLSQKLELVIISLLVNLELYKFSVLSLNKTFGSKGLHSSVIQDNTCYYTQNYPK